MLQFDKKGFLVPDQGLPCSLAEMRRVFVEEFPASGTRLALFENFTEYCRGLMLAMQVDLLSIWVNGSFATRKIAPNDIDVVIFWDGGLIDTYQSILDSLSYPGSLRKHQVDAYFVFIYPENHPKHFETLADTAYWIHQFAKTRPDHRRISYRKGFLALTITADEIEEIRIG